MADPQTGTLSVDIDGTTYTFPADMPSTEIQARAQAIRAESQAQHQPPASPNFGPAGGGFGGGTSAWQAMTDAQRMAAFNDAKQRSQTAMAANPKGPYTGQLADIGSSLKVGPEDVLGLSALAPVARGRSFVDALRTGQGVLPAIGNLLHNPNGSLVSRLRAILDSEPSAAEATAAANEPGFRRAMGTPSNLSQLRTPIDALGSNASNGLQNLRETLDTVGRGIHAGIHADPRLIELQRRLTDPRFANNPGARVQIERAIHALRGVGQ